MLSKKLSSAKVCMVGFALAAFYLLRIIGRKPIPKFSQNIAHFPAYKNTFQHINQAKINNGIHHVSYKEHQEFRCPIAYALLL